MCWKCGSLDIPWMLNEFLSKCNLREMILNPRQGSNLQSSDEFDHSVSGA